MSAFLCDPVAFARVLQLFPRNEKREKLKTLFAGLLLENHRSLAARYPEDYPRPQRILTEKDLDPDRNGLIDQAKIVDPGFDDMFSEVLIEMATSGHESLFQRIKSAQCYLYQSNNHLGVSCGSRLLDRVSNLVDDAMIELDDLLYPDAETKGLDAATSRIESHPLYHSSEWG